MGKKLPLNIFNFIFLQIKLAVLVKSPKPSIDKPIALSKPETKYDDAICDK